MRIGEILVRRGLVTPSDVQAALERQRVHGKGLGANLIALRRLTVDQLVTVLQDQRDLKGLPVSERTLVEWERSFGHNHPNTSRARYNVARLHLAAGNATDALKLGRAALAVQEAALGRNHAWTRATILLIEAAVRATAPATPGSIRR
jgi:hypothetical protein